MDVRRHDKRDWLDGDWRRSREAVRALFFREFERVRAVRHRISPGRENRPCLSSVQPSGSTVWKWFFGRRLQRINRTHFSWWSRFNLEEVIDRDGNYTSNGRDVIPLLRQSVQNPPAVGIPTGYPLNGDLNLGSFPRGVGDGGQNSPEAGAGTRAGDPRP
ncbi:hypothetical protein PIB30_093413 [Stylosanthes scabra]|uniref:Uncharacterized protein n=1 Tax=Stylosanthes scabra TaxID=79078 RepID=A0ABU6SXK5_9FABA|nr:hypothetical protein [Stylosanthes scabra]